MDIFSLIVGFLFLGAGVIRLCTDWAPWPLRVGRLSFLEKLLVHGDTPEEKWKASEKLTAGWYLVIAGLTILLLASGVL
jgi:hypothetical protein